MTLALVLQWYGATSEVPWLFLLSAWIIALIVAAAGYVLWNRRGLVLQLKIIDSRPAPGSPIDDLPNHVLRRAPLPAPIFEGDGLVLEVGLSTTRGRRGPASVKGVIGRRHPVTYSAGVVPSSRNFVLPNLRRGALGAGHWEITATDFVGFFRSRWKCPDQEIALVLPRFASLASRRETREMEASLAAPRAGSGNEVFGIREYRAGDSLRRIHWRSSARHGELVVREYEPPGVQTLGIYVDPSPGSTEVADQIARIAASEAWDCISDGGRVVIWAPGLEPTQSPRDIWGLLEWLARYPSGPSGSTTNPLRGQEEAVLVTAGDAQLLDAIDTRARVRAWVVGEAALDLDIPTQRVGTTWPL